MIAWLKREGQKALFDITKPQRLRLRLMGMLGTITLTIMLLMSSAILYFVYLADVSAWQGRQDEAARNAAQVVSNFFQHAEDSLIMVSLLDRDTIENNPEIIQRLFSHNDSLLEIIRLDAQGKVLVDVFQGHEMILGNLFTIPQSKWFTRARAGYHYFGRLQLSANSQPYLLLALPATDGGVVGARLSMSVLGTVVNDIRFGLTGQIFVIDKSGEMIAHTDVRLINENATLAGNPILTSVLQAPENRWNGQYTNLDGKSVVVSTARVSETDWVVFTETSWEEAYRSSRISFLVLLTGIIILSAVAMLSARGFLEHVILRSIDQLRVGAEQIGQGDLNYRITLNRRDEVGVVAMAFNQMAEQLQQRVAEVAARTADLLNEVERRKKIEVALRQAQEELELRVDQRTAELASANQKLVELNQAAQNEIVERTQAEVRAREALKEREILLKEVHHRVKNNLQVISSLLNLQAAKSSDPVTLEAFRISQARVRSMALIHEKLYQSNDLSKINFAGYLHSLVNSLAQTYRVSTHIAIQVDAEKIPLNIDTAIPCGLIINELVSNSLKYAFPNNTPGTIRVRFSHDIEGRCELKVCDNGIGLPVGLDAYTTQTLGLSLVSNLVRQIDGAMEVNGNPGTCFKILFFAH